MPTGKYRLVLGIIQDMPKAIELYHALLDKGCVQQRPFFLSHSAAGDHDGTLREAGLTHGGSIDGIRLHHHDDPEQATHANDTRSPLEMIQGLLDHSPEVFWSLVDDYLSKGQVLIALNLKDLHEAEISITKTILQYAMDRVHLIDLV